MLKRAWYLIAHADSWSARPPFPQLLGTPALLDSLRNLLGPGCEPNPVRTELAIDVLLHAADHLSDAIRDPETSIGDRERFVRLVHGMNLLTGYLVQVTERMAHHADTQSGLSQVFEPPTPGVDAAADAARVAELPRALVTAACRLEEAAGLFKETRLLALTADVAASPAGRRHVSHPLR